MCFFLCFLSRSVAVASLVARLMAGALRFNGNGSIEKLGDARIVTTDHNNFMRDSA